jgi:cytochrome c-type biogenesis protein CcmH
VTRARRWAPWAALAAVLLVALGVLVTRSQPDDSVGARTTRLARQIKCPDCQGESVANSNTAIARDIRREIRERVERGERDAEVLAYYESRYPDALLAPGGDGIGIVAWGVPAAAIVAALGGLALALRRWSSQPRLSASADDERLVDRARHEVSG